MNLNKTPIIFLVFLISSILLLQSCGSNIGSGNIINSKLPKPIGPYSIYKEKNGMIFISGQIAINPQTNLLVKDSFAAEVKQVLENINVILSELNLKFDDVMVVNVYLRNLDNFNEFNTIYGSYFGNSSLINYPPRVTVEVSKLPKDANIEISLIAIRD